MDAAIQLNLPKLGMRQAFFLAYVERYGTAAINFAMVPILARILTPNDYGIAAIGLAALAFAESIRDFGGSAYIVQDAELTLERIRASFTLTLVLTLVMSSALCVAGNPIAGYYAEPGLSSFLKVMAICFLFGPFVSPVYSLFRREMAFGKIAAIAISSTAVYAIVVIYLAASGFGYMSFAWASVCSGSIGALLGIYLRRDLSIFRVSFSDWRRLIAFGRYDSGATILQQVWEYLPYLIFGRFLNADAVGLYQRSSTLSQLPKRFLLDGLWTIALPALAAGVRQGVPLKRSYFEGLTYIAGTYWPSLAIIALLARPFVGILLGPQWVEAAPLVRIMAAATMMNFGVNFTYPALVAAGKVRSGFLANLIYLPPATAILFVAAQYGLKAVALSMFITVPLQMSVSIYFLQRALKFSLGELLASLSPSVSVTAFSVLGPLGVIFVNGFDSSLSILETAFALVLAGLGWLFGLWVVEHPIGNELRRLIRPAQPAVAPAFESSARQ
jgi:O-antigen/teichoic acid export membrane protein